MHLSIPTLATFLFTFSLFPSFTLALDPQGVNTGLRIPLKRGWAVTHPPASVPPTAESPVPPGLVNGQFLKAHLQRIVKCVSMSCCRFVLILRWDVHDFSASIAPPLLSMNRIHDHPILWREPHFPPIPSLSP